MCRCRGSSASCARASGNKNHSESARSKKQESDMDRRKFLGSAASVGLAAVARPYVAKAAAREILIAEPVHSTGYLPLYVGMAKGFFDDVKVSIVTIETGSGHTNAVLSGQAFAFIGGPEHDAFAKGQGPTGTDWPSYMKGKAIAVGPVGGTPNSITRYLLKKWGLDPKSDVTLLEVANSATLAVVKGKQAQVGVATEPFVTQGVKQSIWEEPFYNVPKQLGPYAYSTLNVRLDSIQKDPELVRAFVRGMVKGLKFTYASPDEASEIAKAQFPTMALEDLRATLDRSFRDEMWSKDGMISKDAWATAKSVVREAGILKSDVAYEEIIDMSFVESVRANL